MAASFAKEKELEAYIQENTRDVFGEEIRWQSMSLPGEDRPIRPDLIGHDTHGSLVIAEVKVVRGSTAANQYDKPRQVIGQMIHYAVAYVQEHCKDDPRDLSVEHVRDALKNVRFFIVTETLHYSLEKMCYFLQAYGLNIRYLALDCL